MSTFGNISNAGGAHVWRLENENGRQTWSWSPATEREAKEQTALGDEYDHATNQNCQDLVFRRAQLKRANFRPLTREQSGVVATEAARAHAGDPVAQQAYAAAAKGAHFFTALQLDDGHWAGDYGGPLFLLPGLVFASHFCSIELGAPRRASMTQYLSRHQNADGGWGLHIEGRSTMYGTCLNYCALRILGVPGDDERAVRGRAFIHANGTALAAPSWAKFWMAVLGVYGWTGVNSLCPEMWLLPTFLPFAPNKFWCHSRMVFLPMSYLFGVRATCPITALTHALRSELFSAPFETLDWVANRGNICPSDIQRAHSWLLDAATTGLNALEPAFHRWPMNKMRARATEYIASYVHAEDMQTNHICIGPVNKVLNMCVTYHHDGAASPLFQQHIARIDDYLWVSEDGMKMQGYNGSQLWDTSFTVLALLDNKAITKRASEALRRAYHYLDITQISEDAPQGVEFFRHINKGAWPFSTKAHGWAISDCTGDALSAVLRLHQSGVLTEEDARISEARLYDAVNILLSFQNADGGWATYENKRASGYLEVLNASEVFDKLMVDYTYVECTSSALQGMINFRKQFPNHRTAEIQRSIDAGTAFIRSIQRPDGSWLGSWAVCFCYAIWFAVDGLVAAGEPRDSKSLRGACEFLLARQHADGGWGESYMSCVRSEYVQHERSQIVHTAWALCALVAAEWPDREPLDRAAQLLISRQDAATGDWPHESIVGVFNASCMITYMNYRNVFALKALNRYCKQFGAAAQ